MQISHHIKPKEIANGKEREWPYFWLLNNNKKKSSLTECRCKQPEISWRTQWTIPHFIYRGRFFIIYKSEPPVECLWLRYKQALMLSLKCPHKPHCFQIVPLFSPPPPKPGNVKSSPHRPALLGLFGDICCHVQILFLAEPSLALLWKNRAGDYFYLSGIDCVNIQNNASLPWSSSCRAGQQLLGSVSTQNIRV